MREEGGEGESGGERWGGGERYGGRLGKREGWAVGVREEEV